MGIIAFLGLILVVLAILKLLGVLALAGAAWVTLMVLGLILLAFSGFVWDTRPWSRR